MSQEWVSLGANGYKWATHYCYQRKCHGVRPPGTGSPVWLDDAELDRIPHVAAIIAERDALREALTTLFAKCRLNDSEAIAIVVVADAMGSCEKEIDLTFVVDALKEGRGD